MEFEGSWEKGKEYFLKSETMNDLILFSQLIDNISEKYPAIREKIETMDTELFLFLPNVLILKCLDERNY